MRAPVLLLLSAVLLGSCSTGSTSSPPLVPDTATSDPSVLPAGKADLVLRQQTYYSPTDFVPPLALTPPKGWHSTHRGDDAFDVSLPDPTKDAALVAVVFLTPAGDKVATALQQLRTTAGADAKPLTGTLAGQPATGFEVTGGSGQLVASASGTIALDLAPGQRVQVLGTDVDGTPLVAITLIPDAARAPAALAGAQALLRSVTKG